MYRKVKEARLLLNALPEHIREEELERARAKQSATLELNDYQNHTDDERGKGVIGLSADFLDTEELEDDKQSRLLFVRDSMKKTTTNQAITTMNDQIGMLQSVESSVEIMSDMNDTPQLKEKPQGVNSNKKMVSDYPQQISGSTNMQDVTKNRQQVMTRANLTSIK